METNLIKLCVSILSVFPKGLLEFMYDCIKPYNGKLFWGIRYCLVSNLVQNIGEKVIIGPNVVFKHWSNVRLGSRISIHDFTYIDGYGGVSIGDDVSIAHNCSILSSSHTWSNSSIPIRLNEVVKQPVSIKNNVWLGCGVRLLGNSLISDDTIVGAGSVVTKPLESNSIYYGVPARFVSNVNS